MPTMHFSDPGAKIEVRKNFPSPVKITDLWKGWYKTCRKLEPRIPEVPELVGHFNTTWLVEDNYADVKWIKYTIRNKFTGEKAYLVIDRKGPIL